MSALGLGEEEDVKSPGDSEVLSFIIILSIVIIKYQHSVVWKHRRYALTVLSHLCISPYKLFSHGLTYY